MVVQQTELTLECTKTDDKSRDNLCRLLSGDLDFHDKASNSASHSVHAFPAKFPPQLPHIFIEGLTKPGDVVLDPMSGSGTTVLEAYLAGRVGCAFDIDPLALLMTRTKVLRQQSHLLTAMCQSILAEARRALSSNVSHLESLLETKWDTKTHEFVDYWFASSTQLELIALLEQIGNIEDSRLRTFFELAFSAIIITKSGGVSLGLDLAHTRPHRAKIVVSEDGDIFMGKDIANSENKRKRYITKTLRSPLAEFEKRVQQNLSKITDSSNGTEQPYLEGLFPDAGLHYPPYIAQANSQAIPLHEASVDLIVTSPPYASNAIDYMRAHKFSLVWFGYSIDELSQKRREYIGGESLIDFVLEPLPRYTQDIVNAIAALDSKKAQVLHRYYSEMTRSIGEMYRVLKPGKAAIVVVGSSVMRGKDTETQTCLAEIGETLGFDMVKIGVRNLDRNRRMMPVGNRPDLQSQIQQRMHEEYVIGFYKPLD